MHALPLPFSIRDGVSIWSVSAELRSYLNLSAARACESKATALSSAAPVLVLVSRVRKHHVNLAQLGDIDGEQLIAKA